MRYIHKTLITFILIFSSIVHGNMVEMSTDVFLSFQVDDVELNAGDNSQINVNARLLNNSVSQYDFNASDYLGPTVSFNTGGLISSPGNTNGLYQWTSFLPEASSNPNLGSLSLAPGESYQFNYGTLTPTTSNTPIGTYESDIGLSYFYNFTSPAETLKDTLTVTINSNPGEVIQESPLNPVDVYGLFIGWNDPVFTDNNPLTVEVAEMNGQGDAQAVRNALIDNAGVDAGNLQFLGLDESNISSYTPNDIKDMIDTFFNGEEPLVDENDLFVLYIASHGTDIQAVAPYEGGEQLTGTSQDEAIVFGNDMLIFDDQLAEWLNNYSDKNKLVLLDSCHSGGFWGNNQESPNGYDLSQVNNTTLLAAASETQQSIQDLITGRSFFSQAIVDAITLNANGDFQGDSDNINGLTAIEIHEYVNQWLDDNVWRDGIPFFIDSQEACLGIANDEERSNFCASLREGLHGEIVPITQELLTSFYYSNSDSSVYISENIKLPTSVSEPPLFLLMITGYLVLLSRFKE